MRMIGRPGLRQVLPFTPLLAAAALSISVAVADKDVMAAPGDSVEVPMPAMGKPTDANTLPPVSGSGQTIRVVEVKGEVSGSEPDPESFDRVGLEHWWRNYQLAHSMRAENAKK